MAYTPFPIIPGAGSGGGGGSSVHNDLTGRSAADAYSVGDRVTFEGAVWESVIDANVWSPTAYPAGWKALAQAAGLA